MKPYKLTDEARVDLLEIDAYIADDNPDAAVDVGNKFYQAFRLISAVPGVGHARTDLTKKPVLFRLVNSYFVVYRVAPSQIDVVAVVHAARDVRRFLCRRLR